MIEDPFCKMNSKLQQALGKLNKRVGVLMRSGSEKEVWDHYIQMYEMLVLYFATKADFQKDIDCEQSTDSQREEATNALTQDNSDRFAKKLIDNYINGSWHMLKRGPINMEETVEILQAIKIKYDHIWTLDDNVPDNSVNPESDASGGLLDLPLIK